MKLSDLERIERNRDIQRQKEQYRLAKKVRLGKIDPELPGVKSTGLVETMTAEERKALFEKLRKESGV
jgi:hypothetical protein